MPVQVSLQVEDQARFSAERRVGGATGPTPAAPLVFRPRVPPLESSECSDGGYTPKSSAGATLGTASGGQSAARARAASAARWGRCAGSFSRRARTQLSKP